MLINFAISTLIIFILSQVLPEVSVKDIWSACILALCLSLVNITIKPLLQLITLPLTFITLGLFTFIVDALIILLLSNVLQGFEVNGFVGALIFGTTLSFANAVLHIFRK
jgi:putative membrane protein